AIASASLRTFSAAICTAKPSVGGAGEVAVDGTGFRASAGLSAAGAGFSGLAAGLSDAGAGAALPTVDAVSDARAEGLRSGAAGFNCSCGAVDFSRRLK